ncbi:helix-turn-helix transcriptional regulator [Brevibacillus agri]|uniref:helix-turn-helix domain-containing protein n=1 Tax=Brevibacillus agri TaxID=51101 RepID=UPI0024BF1EC2|nr:helix-turn-helix transcriptional regulator [Brevibacillus agri]WHX32041.1 helix-turn-helix transcriptional regulator [Brevibacillus agri]
MELSEVVKKARIELGLSQEGLARELHVGFTSVNRWENGHTKPNQIARHALIELCKGKKIHQELIEILVNSK